MYYTWTPKYLRKKWDNIQLLAWDFYFAWRVQVRKKNWSNWHREIHGSMAMQQEPIYWRYLPSTRPIFQGYVREYPQKIWPEIWYVYVPPSVGKSQPPILGGCQLMLMVMILVMIWGQTSPRIHFVVLLGAAVPLIKGLYFTMQGPHIPISQLLELKISYLSIFYYNLLSIYSIIQL